MKYALPFVLGALLLCANLPGASAEAETEAETETETERDTERDTEGNNAERKTDENNTSGKPPKPSAQKNKSKDKEIFIPSEEISEDFAVSFPVDI